MRSKKCCWYDESLLLELCVELAKFFQQKKYTVAEKSLSIPMKNAYFGFKKGSTFKGYRKNKKWLTKIPHSVHENFNINIIGREGGSLLPPPCEGTKKLLKSCQNVVEKLSKSNKLLENFFWQHFWQLFWHAWAHPYQKNL